MPRVGVLGAGIIGLSQACVLQERLPNVEIVLVAEKFSPFTTSDIAAGFWHPYLVGDNPEHVLIRWLRDTFDYILRFATSHPAHGAMLVSGTLWKVGQAGLGYMLTQLAKLLLLATFFSLSDPSEKFALIPEFLKGTADVIDIIGLHLIVRHLMAGKSEVRFVTAGLGWSLANSIATRIISFWVGARATAFSWIYIQSTIDSSSDLFFWISAACLAWLVTRLLASQLNSVGWPLVLFKIGYSIALSIGTVVVYSTHGNLKRD